MEHFIWTNLSSCSHHSKDVIYLFRTGRRVTHVASWCSRGTMLVSPALKHIRHLQSWFIYLLGLIYSEKCCELQNPVVLFRGIDNTQLCGVSAMWDLLHVMESKLSLVSEQDKGFQFPCCFLKCFFSHTTHYSCVWFHQIKNCFVWELYSFAQVITEFWMGGVPSYAELRGRISHLSFVLPEVVGTYTGSDLRKHDTDGDKHEWQILEGFFLPRNLLNSGSLSKQCNLIPYVSLVCLITDTLSTQLVFIYTV